MKNTKKDKQTARQSDSQTAKKDGQIARQSDSQTAKKDGQAAEGNHPTVQTAKVAGVVGDRDGHPTVQTAKVAGVVGDRDGHPTVQKAKVRALVTPLRVPGAVLARGGMATIDLKTAEYLVANNQAVILQVL